MSDTDDDNYTPEFYDVIANGSRSSATVVVPYVTQRIGRPRTVLDVGCGQGWWGKEFERYGAWAVGLDGEYVPDQQLEYFRAHDLREILPDYPTRFDLVVCLEVAEHLPESRAESFIADLCRLGRAVLFSAAIPHQTGAGHVHCRWQSYWADLFEANGLVCDGSIRWRIWEDDRVEPWYRNNLMLATKQGVRTQPLDVVHPVLHEWGRTV